MLRTNTIASLIAVIFLLGIKCKKKCIPKNYNFSINMTAAPDLDSIHVHDTIWVNMDVSATLFDNISGNVVDFSNATNLSTVILAKRFTGGSITDPGGVDANNDFNFKIVAGIIVSNNFPGVLTEIQPSKINGRYLIKCGIVPKSNGTFAISVSDAANVYQGNSNCEKAFFEMNFSNTNQHLYYYQQNRPGYQISQYESKHMYCFKVN